jgi:hypothetical protein
MGENLKVVRALLTTLGQAVSVIGVIAWHAHAPQYQHLIPKKVINKISWFKIV